MKHINEFVSIFTILSFSSVSMSERIQKTCTPTSAGNSSIDDVPSILEALTSCGNGGTIVIPNGQTYMIRSHLDFQNCRGCTIQIDGILKASDDLNYWEGKSSMFSLSNTANVRFYSSTGSGLIDGSGQRFWDHFAVNKTYQRPLLMIISNSSHVKFENFQFKDSPMWFISITDGSSSIEFSDITITAISNSGSKAANTDGFDTNICSNVLIRNVRVHNGDDCVSFKNGSNYITVQNITCIGSHGLSVGSLGESPHRIYIVQNIYISNATMINSSLATRIKFFPAGALHGSVLVYNVTYENINIDNCDYAIQIDNCYGSDPATCRKTPATAGLYGIRFFGIHGTTSTKYDPVVGKIDCPPAGTCDLAFQDWSVISPHGNSKVLCSFYDDPSGITCSPEN